MFLIIKAAVASTCIGAEVPKKLYSVMFAVVLFEPHQTIQRLWCMCHSTACGGFVLWDTLFNG